MKGIDKKYLVGLDFHFLTKRAFAVDIDLSMKRKEEERKEEKKERKFGHPVNPNSVLAGPQSNFLFTAAPYSSHF